MSSSPSDFWERTFLAALPGFCYRQMDSDYAVYHAIAVADHAALTLQELGQEPPREHRLQRFSGFVIDQNELGDYVVTFQDGSRYLIKIPIVGRRYLIRIFHDPNLKAYQLIPFFRMSLSPATFHKKSIYFNPTLQ